MEEDPLLALPTRRAIYMLLVDHPGLYLRELGRTLGMPMGSLEYHLHELVEAGLLSVVHEENKRFFPAQIPAPEKRTLALLRQEPLRRVVISLLQSPDSTHGDLLAETGYPSSTLSFYLRKLVDSGMVDRTKSGRNTRYRMHDAREAYGLLVRYRSTLLDRMLDAFLTSFDAIHLPTKPHQDRQDEDDEPTR
ncbi:MAG: winged helix-turn-helix transcriptional regulator [Thermoplasmatota archaeon]